MQLLVLLHAADNTHNETDLCEQRAEQHEQITGAVEAPETTAPNAGFAVFNLGVRVVDSTALAALPPCFLSSSRQRWRSRRRRRGACLLLYYSCSNVDS